MERPVEAAGAGVAIDGRVLRHQVVAALGVVVVLTGLPDEDVVAGLGLRGVVEERRAVVALEQVLAGAALDPVVATVAEYGVRAREKQRMKAHYHVMEKQFRRYLEKAKTSKGNTAVTLQQLLEMRLDNVVRRLGVVRSIWAARQLVAHGHIKVNGKKCDVPSAAVEVGAVITFKDKAHKLLRENMESNAGHNVPNWLEWNPAQLTAKIASIPVPEDVPFEVNMNLIIEFYR